MFFEREAEVSVSYYDEYAADIGQRYESLSSEKVHQVWLEHLPPKGAAILDVGAGSGRDAAWLAALGYEVVAVEPSAGMRAFAQEHHAEASIRWLDDRLPGLERTYALEMHFDVILCSAVWMHVAPSERERAFRKLAQLLKPKGLLIFTLRQGPPPAQPMFAVSSEELVRFSHRFALESVRCSRSEDRWQRDGVFWETLIFRLADDGTGSLPLLRHIILHDMKTATYKIALLRTLLRIAEGAMGAVIRRDESQLVLPLGLVALYWLRLYKPLLHGASPMPQISGERRLGFVGDAFDALRDLSAFDLRVGAKFSPPFSIALYESLRLAIQTIQKGPVTYTTYPASLHHQAEKPVFSCQLSGHPPKPRDTFCLDLLTLGRFGTFALPRVLWDAFALHGCWIEPALLQGWIQQMQSYDQRLGISRDLSEYYGALQWLDPKRDTQEVRASVERLLEQGRAVYCVWSGKRLSEVKGFAVDHCFPFAYWPNNDLWNLFPTRAEINQKKSDRLPSASLLASSQERILGWWEISYTQQTEKERFFEEAQIALPLLFQKDAAFPVVFEALQLQRLRLRQHQQLAEWEGP